MFRFVARQIQYSASYTKENKKTSSKPLQQTEEIEATERKSEVYINFILIHVRVDVVNNYICFFLNLLAAFKNRDEWTYTILLFIR